MRVLAGNFKALVIAMGCIVPLSASANDKIVGGDEVSDQGIDQRFLATVALTRPELQKTGHSFCSGTLVAPNVVLTAAHCLVDGKNKPRPGEYLVTFGARVAAENQTRKVIQRIVHPDYSEALALTPLAFKPAHDVGLVILDGPFEGAQHIEVFQGDIARGKMVTLVGFGVTTGRNNNDTGVMRYTDMGIVRIRQNLNRLVTGSLTHGVCAGDSGGPMMLEEEGKWFVTGVTSSGSQLFGRCIGVNNFTDARPYFDWIQSVIAENE